MLIEWLYRTGVAAMKQGIWCVIVTLAVGMLAACSQPPQGSAPPTSTETAQSSKSKVPSISGTYVAIATDSQKISLSVQALRITQSGPNQFTGSFESASMDKAGKQKADTTNVSGTLDGTHFTLVFDQGFGQHLNRTGTIDAQGLTLTWMDNGQLSNEKFALKTDAEYGQVLAQFKNGSAQLQRADEERIALGKEGDQASALTTRINRFLQIFPTWNADRQRGRHDQAMRKGQAALVRVKQLMKGDDVARNQADVLVNQMQVFQNQLQIANDGTANEVGNIRKRLAEIDAAVSRTSCIAADGSLAPNAPPACEALPEAIRSYREKRPKADVLLQHILTLDQQTVTDFDQVLHEAEQAAQGETS